MKTYNKIKHLPHDLKGYHSPELYFWQKLGGIYYPANKITLPDDYWNFIVQYLPNYSSDDRVLEADILTKFLDDELNNNKDFDKIQRDFQGRKVLVKAWLDELELKLYIEALMAESEQEFYGDKPERNFPNGFESWQETHFEVVAEITRRSDESVEGGKVTTIEETKGHGGLYELAKELTDKFEEYSKGKEWDGEWREELEKFLDKELSMDA